MADQPADTDLADNVETQHVSSNQSFTAAADAATSSLFPAYAGATGQQAPGWLQNVSFPGMAAQSKPAASVENQETRSEPMLSSLQVLLLLSWHLRTKHFVNHDCVS